MTISKFVEHLDTDCTPHDPELHLEANHSTNARMSSDSSTSTKSHNSSSPSSSSSTGDKVSHHDRFPSPTRKSTDSSTRKSTDSSTDSPIRRKLRKLTLRKVS